MTDICSQSEILISSWMDNELEQREVSEMLDHLVRCESCREFYRQARALEGVVVAAGMAPGAEPSAADLWEKIETSVDSGPKTRHWTWLMAAALAIVGLALAFTLAPRLDREVDFLAATNETAEIEVELGSRSGEMTEERFLEIATEVLESDRRYQQAMLRVMDSVIDDQPATEGGGDTLTARGEGPRKDENTGGRA